MKRLAVLFAIFSFSAALASSAVADDAPEIELTDSAILNKLPALANEELKQVLFAGKSRENASALVLDYEIQNPFRDREILGIVVTVTLKEGPDGKPASYDTFIRVDVPALKMTRNSESVFDGLSDKVQATFALKEVHCKIDAR